MKIICAIFFLFLTMAAMAQPTFSGRVVEAGTARPIALGSVFVGNSSVGTTTNETGNFILYKVPAGKFTLVVSCIGYETFARQMENGKIPEHLTVELVHKINALNEVVVTAAEKNGWITWGDVFIENFIGKSTYARDCRIKNPQVLHFSNSIKNNTLKVWSDEPLIIENNALGYTLSYDLHEFIYNLSDYSVTYSGYPFFTAMLPKDRKEEARIKENRKRVYALSLLHFIRSLYGNTTAEEGFRIVRNLNKKQFDLRNKPAVITAYDGVEKYDTIYEISNRETLIKIVPAQNSQVKNNVQADTDPSSIGNIITNLEADRKALYFTDTLQVMYTKARTPYEYEQYETSNKGAILSGISLVQDRPVTLFANGSYFANSNLNLSGFWAWWEKIAIMLPYDYEPEETPIAGAKTAAVN